MQELKEDFEILDLLFKSCDIDYRVLKSLTINEDFFNDYSNQRIVNSFLFNYIKIQDKIGTKLFKKVLYELKEISDYSIPMIDILNSLEKLNIINSSAEWDRLREIRNTITYEYPADLDDRIENISLALGGYIILENIFVNIKNYCQRKGLI